MGVAACEPAPEPPPSPPEPPPAAPAEVPGDPVPPVDNRFDPGNLRVGQEVLGLRVAGLDVRPADPPDSGYAGFVRFAGEVTVSGSYRSHPAYPSPGAELVCFFVDAATAPRLPRFRTDERYPWFCFDNQEDAVRELGSPESAGRATVVIDDYKTERRPADVFDTARLLMVISRDTTVGTPE